MFSTFVLYSAEEETVNSELFILNARSLEVTSGTLLDTRPFA